MFESSLAVKRQNHLKQTLSFQVFKDCIPQILFGPFLNSLSQINSAKYSAFSNKIFIGIYVPCEAKKPLFTYIYRFSSHVYFVNITQVFIVGECAQS